MTACVDPRDSRETADDRRNPWWMNPTVFTALRHFNDVSIPRGAFTSRSFFSAYRILRGCLRKRAPRWFSEGVHYRPLSPPFSENIRSIAPSHLREGVPLLLRSPSSPWRRVCASLGRSRGAGSTRMTCLTPSKGRRTRSTTAFRNLELLLCVSLWRLRASQAEGEKDKPRNADIWNAS